MVMQKLPESFLKHLTNYASKVLILDYDMQYNYREICITNHSNRIVAVFHEWDEFSIMEVKTGQQTKVISKEYCVNIQIDCTDVNCVLSNDKVNELTFTTTGNIQLNNKIIYQIPKATKKLLCFVRFSNKA